jgi:hypothetical protein
MKKLNTIFFGLILTLSIGSQAAAQNLELFNPLKKWILKNNNILRNEIELVEYKQKKVKINTMVWQFMPNGKLEYDYQTGEDVDACLGVDFLDIDLDESRWTYNPSTLTLTLMIKGGYASLDDFIFKKEYRISLIDDDNEYGYNLDLEKEYYFNDLTRFRKK